MTTGTAARPITVLRFTATSLPTPGHRGSIDTTRRNPQFRGETPIESVVSLARVGPMADTTFRNVVNGELVDSVSGETYDVIDPTTGEVYAQAPKSGAEDVDRAYAAAADAFESWGRTTPQDRAAALLKIADAIEARTEELNSVECRDTGKPLGLTRDEEMPYASD